MNGEKHRFFKDEISRKLTHAKAGTVAMANAGTANTNGSQFYITLRDGLEDQLDGKNTVFGEVVDGLEVLDVISNAYCDDGGRPYIDIRYVPCCGGVPSSVGSISRTHVGRIKHTLVIDDPTDDIPGFDEMCPDESPELVRPTSEVGCCGMRLHRWGCGMTCTRRCTYRKSWSACKRATTSMEPMAARRRRLMRSSNAKKPRLVPARLKLYDAVCSTLCV